MTKRSLWIVAYDICHARRLRRVLHVVKGYSTGGQRSVHECWLSRGEWLALVEALGSAIDPREDSVLLIAPERRTGVRTLGVAVGPRDAGFFYLG